MTSLNTKDLLGLPIAITNSLGNEVKGYKYYAFGKLREETGDLQNTHTFTGQELDGTGLYYYKMRYYDANTGRFITLDNWTWLPDDEQMFALSNVEI